ncbi:ATPase [Yersinia phage phiR1-37]|uniref:ATPase n=1 Tax=Yersinia phage phiR1-37 TaxID=331278 RepID=UPI00022DBDDB|nr:ATPase [Yersinia phage phiR1-37]CCE26327.1 ATPase [Yersinia phage phiR1-37]
MSNTENNVNAAAAISSSSDMIECTHKTIIPVLIDAVYSRTPIIIWGNTGVGKTELLHQLARMFGIEPRDRQRYIDQRMNSCDAPDVRGCIFPDKETGRTVVYPPAWIPTAKDGLPRFIVLEEINTIQDDTVQAALYEMLQERRNGDIDLADEVAIFATANLEEDNGPTVELAGPVKNRVKHIRLLNTVECWLEMAEANNYHPFLTAYIRRYGMEKLYAPDFEKNAFRTNRTWSKVNQTISNPLYQETLGKEWGYKHIVPDFVLPKFAAGTPLPVPDYAAIIASIGTTIGASGANEFSTFVTHAQSVLPLMKIFDEGNLIPENQIINITDHQYYALIDMMRRTMIDRHEAGKAINDVFIRNVLNTIMIGAKNSSLLSTEFRQANMLRINQAMKSQFTVKVMQYRSQLGQIGADACEYFKQAGAALSEMAAA